MRIPDSLVETLLLSSGRFTPEQLARVREQELSEKRPLQDLVITTHLLSEKDLTKLYAEHINVPFVELRSRDIDREVLNHLPERIARQHHSIVFEVHPVKGASVAMADPSNTRSLTFLNKQLGANLRIFVAPESSIQATLDRYRGSVSSELTTVLNERVHELLHEEPLHDDSPIAQTVNLIIEHAVEAGASDIHIEPRSDYVMVRYRVDGALRQINKLPVNVAQAIVGRVKSLAHLSVSEHRSAQDGRFKVHVANEPYTLQVSVLPTLDGEKLTIHILRQAGKVPSLEALGFWGESLKDIQRVSMGQHGLVLVAGSASAGTSTTLFSMASLLNSPTVSIATIEDSIPYQLTGANQTQVNEAAGITYASGLQAILRQDPNVILVGELRDQATATLSLQTALSGRAVFSGVRAPDALAALSRLLLMGVEPFMAATALRLVVGQQLVRRLCIHCRQAFTPDAKLLKQIDKAFSLGGSEGFHHLHSLDLAARQSGLGKDDKPASSSSGITQLFAAHPDGCQYCNFRGYKGRTTINEVLKSTEAIQQLIGAGAQADKLKAQAIKDGMIPLRLDGLVKALQGITTIEEVLRVTS